MVLICLFLCRSVSLPLFFFPSSSSAGRSISSRSTCSCFTSPLLFPFLFRPLNLVWPRPSFSFSFSSGLYFCAPDVPPVANIVFPPPLDMAKEAICALLAILEHFFEAFSPLDLFFAPAPFRPVPRPFPASLHPGCRHLTPLPIPFLHRFQPIPSPARPLKSTSSRPGSHPSRRHPPVLSSSSELLSLSTSVALRGRLPSPHRLSLRRLVAIARATTPSASPQAIMSAPAPSTMSPQAARPLVCFCSSRRAPAPVPACDFLPTPAAAPALAPSCARLPRSWREALQGPLRSVLVTDPPRQIPSVMPTTARTLSGRGVPDRARRNSPRQSLLSQKSPGRGSVRVGGGFSDMAQRRCPAGRRIGSGQPPAQHKSIAGGCLFPAPAAIVLGQEPELRDAGVSRFVENGSHLAVAPVTDAAGVHVGGPGSSGNAGIGSHLAGEDVAEDHAGQMAFRRERTRAWVRR